MSAVIWRSVHLFVWRSRPFRDIECDGCGGLVIGCRFLCLGCITPNLPKLQLYESCDACKLSCLEEEFEHDAARKRHLPTHDILKLRTGMTFRDFPAIYRASLEALRQARRRFGGIAAEDEGELGSVIDYDDGSSDGQGRQRNVHSPDGATEQDSLDEDEDIGRDPSLSIPASDLTSVHATTEPIVPPPGEEEVQPNEVTKPEEIRCKVCKQPIVMPCWFCVTCRGRSVKTSNIILSHLNI